MPSFARPSTIFSSSSEIRLSPTQHNTIRGPACHLHPPLPRCLPVQALSIPLSTLSLLLLLLLLSSSSFSTPRFRCLIHVEVRSISPLPHPLTHPYK
ncbi:hypothetical protein LX32DRAFT_189104 [Colletotrichum zoysiae]|uniref:Uncharacterized protein n=1 Tax=Colletotrichum zoysiae TaxID=1216348 RepID=A0AAD9HNN3_9PEZI|nr:hypothetical protein LX32DRAFT_189104 [Colletotrichum zoysiae]